MIFIGIIIIMITNTAFILFNFYLLSLNFVLTYYLIMSLIYMLKINLKMTIYNLYIA